MLKPNKSKIRAIKNRLIGLRRKYPFKTDLALLTLISTIGIWLTLSLSASAQSATREALIRLFNNPAASIALFCALSLTAFTAYIYLDYKKSLKSKLSEEALSPNLIHHGKTKTLPKIKNNKNKILKSAGYVALCFGLMFFVVIMKSGATRAYDANEFVTTWKTDNSGSSANNQITIFDYGNVSGYNYTVEWEEVGNPSNNGTAGPFTDSNFPHTLTFPTIGTYEVRIEGDLPSFNTYSSGDQNKILTVEQWGSNQWTTLTSAFYGAINLTVPATDAPNLSNVTNLSAMFRGATSFNQPIDHWDVSNVTNMGYMFHEVVGFNQPLNNWDVSSVTDMTRMFSGATSFNQPLNNWDVSSVTSMSSMFSRWLSNDEHAFNQEIGNWNVANVTDMGYMFHGSKFNQPIDSWNIISATNIESMFGQATSFNQPLNGWDVSNIQYMGGMLNGATNFNQPLNNWDVSNVVDMGYFFGNGSGLSVENYDATLSSWSNQALNNNVIFDAGTSKYCSSEAARDNIINNFGWTITDSGKECVGLPFITAWKTDNPGETAPNQIQIPTIGSGYNYNVEWEQVSNTSVSGTAGPFTGNATITFPTAGTYRVEISGDFPRIYFFNDDGGDQQKILTVEQWGDQQWTSMERAFRGATNIQFTATDAPNLSNVTSMNSMLTGAIAFNSSINHWDVSNVTDMAGLFSGGMWGNGVFNQPLNNWDVSNVTNMAIMFYHQASFNQSLSEWDVSNVTSMAAMLTGSILSVDNYDATLISWSHQPLQNNVPLSITANYCDAAAERESIISTFNWDIGDFGVNCANAAKEVATEQPETIDSSTARLKGSVSGDGSISFTSAGFEWGLASNTLSDEITNLTITSQNFSHQTDFECDTQYFYRAFAETADTTRTYGLVATFTIPCPEEVPENQAPTVQITSPANNQVFQQGEKVVLTANASDSDGEVAEVRFYLNGELVGSPPQSPYTADFENGSPGEYSFVAVAEDNENAETATSPVVFNIVANPGEPEAPDSPDPKTPLAPKTGALGLAGVAILIALASYLIAQLRTKKSKKQKASSEK